MPQSYLIVNTDACEFLRPYLFGDTEQLASIAGSEDGVLAALSYLLANGGTPDRMLRNRDVCGAHDLLGSWANGRIVVVGTGIRADAFTEDFPTEGMNLYEYAFYRFRDISSLVIDAMRSIAGPDHPLCKLQTTGLRGTSRPRRPRPEDRPAPVPRSDGPITIPELRNGVVFNHAGFNFRVDGVEEGIQPGIGRILTFRCSEVQSLRGPSPMTEYARVAEGLRQTWVNAGRNINAMDWGMFTPGSPTYVSESQTSFLRRMREIENRAREVPVPENTAPGPEPTPRPVEQERPNAHGGAEIDWDEIRARAAGWTHWEQVYNEETGRWEEPQPPVTLQEVMAVTEPESEEDGEPETWDCTRCGRMYIPMEEDCGCEDDPFYDE